MQSVKDVVNESLAPLVESLGYVLVDVEYKKMPNGMNLTLFIDGVDGIDMDGLEKVHRAVDKALDELDPTNGAPYTLNCSSLGLDRALKTDYEFNKYKGKEIEVKFYEPLKPYNKKELICVLHSWDADSITLEIESENITLSKKTIAQIVPSFKF